MVYRLDVILEDGVRRKARYDSEKPDVVEIAKCPFGPKDVMLKDAYFITTNPELKQMITSNGFSTERPNKSNNLCVRMDDAMSDQVFEIAQKHGKKQAAIVRIAVQYWLDNGHPMPQK